MLHFTREFLLLAFAVNSSTNDAAWPKALSLMSAPPRGRRLLFGDVELSVVI